MTTNVWHLTPLNVSVNSPIYKLQGDTPPSAGAIATALGLDNTNSTNRTRTQVTAGYYLYSYGNAAGDAAFVFALVRVPYDASAL